MSDEDKQKLVAIFKKYRLYCDCCYSRSDYCSMLEAVGKLLNIPNLEEEVYKDEK